MKKYAVLAALLIIALVLASCAAVPVPAAQPQAAEPQAAATASTSAEPVTLTILAFVPEKYYRPLFDAFEASHPNIKINLEAVTLDTSVSAVLQRYSAGDTTYDIVLADQSWTGSLAGPGALLDLTDTAYGKEAKAKFPESVLAGSTYQGKLVAGPYWGSFEILFYNKTLLQQAGVDFPSQDPAAAWTYEQVFEAAKKAQAAGAKWGYAEYQPGNYYGRQPLIESAGGGSGLTGPDLLTPDVNNAGWKTALTFYGKIFAEGLSPRGLVCCAQADPFFNNGELAFYVSQAPIAGALDSDVDYGIAPMPKWEGGKGYSPSGSGAWGVNPNSPHIDAALEFISFHTLTLEGAMAGTEVAGIPALPEGAAARLAVAIEADPRLAGLDTLQAAMSNLSVARPPSTKYSAFEIATNAAILDIENGLDVTVTLDALQEKLTALLSR